MSCPIVTRLSAQACGIHLSIHPSSQRLAVKSLLGAPSPLGNRKRIEPDQRLGVSQALKSLYFLIYVSGSHEVGGDSSTSCPAPAVSLSLQLPPTWVGGVWGSCLLPHSCLLSPRSLVFLSRRHSYSHPALSFPGTGRLLLNPVLPPSQLCGKRISCASHFPTPAPTSIQGAGFYVCLWLHSVPAAPRGRPVSLCHTHPSHAFSCSAIMCPCQIPRV